MEDTLCFGIDFGTTYSGVSYAHSSDRKRIEGVVDWEHGQGSISEKGKVPTCITYHENGGIKDWGYEAARDPNALRWFKLLLLNHEDLQQHYRGDPMIQNAKSELRKRKKNVVEVVADFLRVLWNHALASIARSESQGFVDICKFKVVMTLPAIWPAYAQERMKEATRLAGIVDQREAGHTILDFVAEPEAAALATLQDKFEGKKSLKVGDRFAVCDSGGGTTDIITYECIKNCPLKIKEAVQGDGALCGGAWVDSAFVDFLKSQVGSHFWKRLDNYAKQSVMSREWDTVIKPQFGHRERDWEVMFPARDDVLREGFEATVKLSHTAVTGIFDPKVKEILNLVDGQIKDSRSTSTAPPKYIILAGGFGQSPYLYKRMKAKFKNIEVLQSSGMKPWTAISRGAVIHGFNNDGSSAAPKAGVASRISRASYGTICIERPWIEGRHRPEDKEWSDEFQQDIAVNQVQYFLGIGSETRSNHPAKRQFEWNIGSPNEDIQAELVYSNEDPPPTRRDETVKHLCTVHWEGDRPPMKDLPVYTNPLGHEYRTVHYDLHLATNGASMNFTIHYKGKRVGRENITVDYAGSGNAPQEEVDHDDSSDEDYSE